MKRRGVSLGLALVLAACSGGGEETESDPPPVESCDPAGPTVVWKRVDALAADLGRALELDQGELCTEIGSAPCAEVHRVALGGSDPLNTALYRPFAEPLATTPLAIERLALSACVLRVDRDAAGAPEVFSEMPLDSEPLSASNAGSAFAKQAASLGRRMLARDLTVDEIATLEPLGRDEEGAPVTSHDAAVLLCFTLATSTEMSFF